MYPKEKWGDAIPIVVTGGMDGTMIVRKQVFGLSLSQKDANGLKITEAHPEFVFPDMPHGRYLHQSVRVGWDIYVLGGK